MKLDANQTERRRRRSSKQSVSGFRVLLVSTSLGRMAHGGVLLDKDQFTCSVCLEVLKEPVTIPCGHSYCSDCIRSYWDQDDYLGVFVCPQCRQTFNPRPVLARSTLLADVVERFKQSGLQEASAGQSVAEADDVECDVCPERKNKAVNSCLVCLASYCDLHVRQHYEYAALKKHKLVMASKRLQEMVCARHHKLLEVYCRTDKQCICSLCLTDHHKGHDAVTVEVEIQQQQRQLGEMKLNSQQSIQQREKEAQELRQSIFSLNRSARLATETSECVFTELIRSIDLKRFEIRELITAQEKLVVSQCEQLLEKIHKDITEQRRVEADLDKLAQTEDHLHFLQSFQSLKATPASSPLQAVALAPNLTFDPATKAVCDFKALLQEICQGGFVSIYEKVRDVVLVGSPAPPAHTEVTPLPIVNPPIQMGAIVHSSQGLDQSPVSPFRSSLHPEVPIFVFSPFGPKLSSGSRQRGSQRRPRKKHHLN
ncbi:finTRIM family, member 67 isoform X2 [Entelurus aequoreus]|uniref:finTRIM family, member 67 isoform X2 n=1 Tax=Entelurus aequoreus TaxID=161455 RepID=UPI002B1D5A52|nr:finTRIM family, member 67 isoform X2 [Entelurus aequoreus]